MQLDEGTLHHSSSFFRMQAVAFSTYYAAETGTNTEMVEFRNNIPEVKLL